METLNADFKFNPFQWQADFLADMYAPRHIGNEYRLPKTCCAVVGRQHGKSELAIIIMLGEAFQHDNYSVAYFAPTSAFLRKEIWPRVLEKITNSGLEKYCKISEMNQRVTLPNGSTLSFYSMQDEAGIRGQTNDFCILDETDICSQVVLQQAVLPTMASKLHARILFIGTLSGGISRLWEMIQKQQDSPDFCYTIVRASEAGVMTEEQVEFQKAQMSASAYMREFECDPLASPEHSIFPQKIEKARKDGRVKDLTFSEVIETYTAWDLGINDACAIIGFQRVGDMFHIQFMREYNDCGIPEVVDNLRREFPHINWGECLLPWDIAQRSNWSGNSRLDMFDALGFGEAYPMKQFSIADSIAAAMVFFEHCVFDKSRCEKGLNHLLSWQYEYDEKRGVSRRKPSHSIHSHTGDAWRYASMQMCLDHDLSPVAGKKAGSGMAHSVNVLRSF